MVQGGVRCLRCADFPAAIPSRRAAWIWYPMLLNFRREVGRALEVAEKLKLFVILSEAKNPSSI